MPRDIGTQMRRQIREVLVQTVHLNEGLRSYKSSITGKPWIESCEDVS